MRPLSWEDLIEHLLRSLNLSQITCRAVFSREDIEDGRRQLRKETPGELRPHLPAPTTPQVPTEAMCFQEKHIGTALLFPTAST